MATFSFRIGVLSTCVKQCQTVFYTLCVLFEVFSVHARGEDVYPTAGQADSTEAPAFNFSMPMHTPAKEWKATARKLLRHLVSSAGRAPGARAVMMHLTATVALQIRLYRFWL